MGIYKIYLYIQYTYDSDGFSIAILIHIGFPNIRRCVSRRHRNQASLHVQHTPGQTHRGSQQRSHRNISVERGQLTAALSTKVFKFRVRQAVCGLVGPLPFGHSPHTGHSSSSQLLPSQYIQTSAKGLPMPPTCPARRATY